MITQITHTDLSQPIYEKLKEMILNQSLKPGQKIIQEKIAADLGVSRTPLNKALQMLEHEMLVESIPRRGMYVYEVSTAELIEVYYCRESLEGLAARLVALNHRNEFVEKLKKLFKPFEKTPYNVDKYREADKQFHQLLIDNSGNSMLKKLYFFGNVHTKVVQTGLVRTPEDTLEEHKAIISAIENNDADQAEFEMRNHIARSRELLIKHQQNQELTK